MGIFNTIKNLSDKAIKRADTTFEVLYGDYVKRDELLNYYDKTKPITTTNPIDMGGNKITSLGDPVDDTDAINKSFLNKRIAYATRNLKTDINTSIADLTKTNNDKVIDLETKIVRGATDLSEIQKTLTNNIRAITDTLTELNKKDTLTAAEIKNINDKLVNELKSVETKMNDFNKMFIDTEELQSEITKTKNSLISSLTNKDIADAAVVKTDISNVKSSIEDYLKQIRNINVKIASINADLKDLKDKGVITAALETKINDFNTQKTLIDEEIKREITNLQKKNDEQVLLDLNIAKELEELATVYNNLQTSINELEKKHTIIKEITDLNVLEIQENEKLIKDYNADYYKKITDLNTKITNVETTTGNSIQIINTASKTLNDNTNIKVDDLSNKLNDLSLKIPFQFIIATIVATDKADKVEIFGVNISKSLTRKDVYYDIISRVGPGTRDSFKSFKTTFVYNSYFDNFDNSILLTNVGLRFFRGGTYVIQTKFHISIKPNRNVQYLQLDFIHQSGQNLLTYPKHNIQSNNKDYKWMEYIKFNVKINDTLDIHLNAIGITHEDIFNSFNNSSIEIYYIDFQNNGLAID